MSWMIQDELLSQKSTDGSCFEEQNHVKDMACAIELNVFQFRKCRHLVMSWLIQDELSSQKSKNESCFEEQSHVKDMTCAIELDVFQ